MGYDEDAKPDDVIASTSLSRHEVEMVATEFWKEVRGLTLPEELEHVLVDASAGSTTT